MQSELNDFRFMTSATNSENLQAKLQNVQQQLS